MSAQSITKQVRWQDLEVRSEVDIILEIAQKKGWEDCEIFGYGDMITKPRESMGWNLIPADIYEYSIPAEGVGRVHQIINAGIRIQGIIIADDERKTEPLPSPAKPKASLPSVTEIASSVRRALLRLISIATEAASFVQRALRGSINIATEIASFVRSALLGLIRIAGGIALIALSIKYFLVPLIILGLIIVFGASTDFDPKLVILVDDGNGSTVWVSVFAWYD